MMPLFVVACLVSPLFHPMLCWLMFLTVHLYNHQAPVTTSGEVGTQSSGEQREASVLFESSNNMLRSPSPPQLTVVSLPTCCNML